MIDPEQIQKALHAFAGQRVYLHFEFPTGGFVRNLTADVLEAHLKGEGPYRVALRCQGDGWVIMDGLTHAEVAADGTLFVGALESATDLRLSRCILIGWRPFQP